jgi:hypothetical protein
MKNLLARIKKLSVHKTYVIYSLLYGLSTLIIPLGVQFLVNNLALSGLWLNISFFISFIIFSLFFSQVIKHSQVILLESLQREIFCLEVLRWKNLSSTKYSHYFFEIFSLLKSFSKSYSSLIEIALVIVFGISTIVLFHPLFLIMAFIIFSVIFQIVKSSAPALESSISESDEKYKVYDLIKEGKDFETKDIKNYLLARDNHFGFIRLNSLKMSSLTVITQAIVLALGCYLIKINELSVGQLVSAEIIISGIFSSLSKFPQILEAVYDYETSIYKLDKAHKGGSNARN